MQGKLCQRGKICRIHLVQLRKIGVAKPKVIIPVFPGTNCEYDTAKAFARAGADPEILVIRNLTPADVAESCKALVKAIDNSQIAPEVIWE